MKIRIALLDSDLCYRDRFMEEWKRKNRDPLEMHWFVSWEECQASPLFSTFRLFLLKQEFLDTSPVPIESFPTRFIRWDAPSPSEGIQKYQSVSEMVQQILHVVSTDMEPLPHDSQKGTLVLFTSSEGGIGTSSITQAAALVLAAGHSDQHIFYMEMDPFGRSLKGFAGNDNSMTSSYTVADVILAMRLPYGNVPLRIQACVTEMKNVRMLRPPHRPADFYEITAEEWKQLFLNLKESESVILLDCASAYLGLYPELCSCVDRTVYVSSGDGGVEPEAMMEALSMRWTPGRDALVLRDAKYRGTNVLAVPFLKEIERKEINRSRVVHALAQQRNIQEVAQWIHA